MSENIVIPTDQDTLYMQQAIEQATRAGQNNEVPIGAVLVDQSGTILAAAGNSCIADNDPTAHAEMKVLSLEMEEFQREAISKKGMDQEIIKAYDKKDHSVTTRKRKSK